MFEFLKRQLFVYDDEDRFISIKRPFGDPLEVDRCVRDQGLVTNSQASVSRHVGHHMRGAGNISLFELILIWMRFIR